MLLLLVTIQVWLSAATKVFNILPDESTHVSCPSQPCATLSQYLLDNNGTLPIVSNVEYRFLPGEHLLHTKMTLEYLSNVSFVGVESDVSSPVILISCSSNPYFQIAIICSQNVTIGNITFKHYKTATKITYLLLGICISCKLESIIFLQGGFITHNAFGNYIIKNVSIEHHQVLTANYLYNFAIELLYDDELWDSEYFVNTVEIIDSSITGMREISIFLNQTKYDVVIAISNSLFYKMLNKVITITANVATQIRIENCTFLTNQFVNTSPMIKILIQPVYKDVTFLNCHFYQNDYWDYLIAIDALQAFPENTNCTTIPNVILQGCKFVNNASPILRIFGDINSSCMLNIVISGPSLVNGNSVPILSSPVISVAVVTMKLDGPVIVSNNYAGEIIYCQACSLVFAKDITFISNFCSSVVVLYSEEHYIQFLEYSNVEFTRNSYFIKLIILQPIHNGKPYLFCGFQYTTSRNISTAHVALIAHYNITFMNNYLQNAVILPSDQCNPNIYHFTSHCRWIPSTVFYGYNPAVINQQILQTDEHGLGQHTFICYCSHNITNCSVDVLGPVYPGQVLQVDLCAPNGDEHFILYVETHNKLLPASACRIAHQAQLLQTIKSYSSTFNFTIVTEEKERCELFITASPCIYDIYEAFYVEILPCPVGFMLHDGVCDCDPYLSNSNIHIDTCSIDQSTITRPANTWITAHYFNKTKYLISHNCPMDYCLPHSSHLNLLNADLQCQFNRTGILCSQCQHSLSMVFGSSRCIHCPNIYVLVTLIIIVAGIVLVVLLYLLNLTVTTGTINGIIFYANIISINDSVFLTNVKVFQPLLVFISFANLDLGIETCFYNGMDGYAKMFLQLFFPFYLIVIAASIIVVSRHSSRILRWTYTRSLPVLATLFLLSYNSVLRAVLTVLFSYSTITQLPSGHQQLVWSIDASVPLFGLKFIVLFIICLVLFVLLIPFNIILLFTRYLSQFRIINQFKPLLDAFQGSYKDRYYYWVGVQFILRSVFFGFYAFQMQLRLILTAIILILFTTLYGYSRPYKNGLVCIQELSLLLNLTIMYAVSYQSSGAIFSIVTNVMISLALIQFCTIVLYHFLIYTCQCNIVTALQTGKQKFIKLFSKKIDEYQNVNDLALLNIPDPTYNYSEYRDGLVSDDFEYNH